MKVGGTRPVAAVASVGAPRDAKRREERTTDGVREITDTASVMGIPEIELTSKVRDAIMALMREVEKLRRELDSNRAQITELKRMADQDSLIAVFNRRAFVRELSRVLSYSERYGTPSSVLYFDINSFKAINDTYGHAAGDAVIERVAKILTEEVRESDVVGRLGGDEFGVILSHADNGTAREKAQMLAQRIRDSAFAWDGHSIKLDVAYGIYSFKQGEDAQQALEAADKAMYAHKNDIKKRG